MCWEEYDFNSGTAKRGLILIQVRTMSWTDIAGKKKLKASGERPQSTSFRTGLEVPSWVRILAVAVHRISRERQDGED